MKVVIEEDQATILPDVDKMLGEIQKLPSLPTLIMEIMASINDDRIDIRVLAKKISQDQALVARVMRVANSPFFGLSGQVGSIDQAIILLGFNSLRGLVIAAGVVRAFPRIAENFDQRAFWRHSVSTGVSAKILAKRSGLNQETAFTAGLLHDIGRLVMVVYFPDGFKRVEKSATDGLGLLEAECAVFGMDHAMLGAKVAEHWNFPLEITQAVKEHHNPLKVGAQASLVDAVYVADLLAHAMKGNGAMEDDSGYIAAEAWARLGLDGEALYMLSEEVERLQGGAFMLIGE